MIPAPTPEPVVAVAEAPAAPVAPAVSEPVVEVVAEAVAATTPVAETEPLAPVAVDLEKVEEIVAAESAPAAVAPETPAPAPAPVKVAEPVDLDKTLAESGLVLVQTTATAAVVAQPEAPVKLGRPRKPKAQTTSEEVSLVMVETQK